jgi:hypothetical protein
VEPAPSPDSKPDPAPEPEPEASPELTDGEWLELLRKRRRARIVELEAYASAGQFPHNHGFAGERRPYLMDRHGRLCAVAYLIATSAVGEEFDYDFFQAMNQKARRYYMRLSPEQRDPHRETKRRTHATISALLRGLSEQDNQVRIADVMDGPILAWILTSGFTQEECARIQPDYVYLSCNDCLPGSEEGEGVEFGSPRAEARATAEQDGQRIQKHLTSVAAKLKANTEASLAIALQRLKESGT